MSPRKSIIDALEHQISAELPVGLRRVEPEVSLFELRDEKGREHGCIIKIGHSAVNPIYVYTPSPSR